MNVKTLTWLVALQGLLIVVLLVVVVVDHVSPAVAQAGGGVVMPQAVAGGDGIALVAVPLSNYQSVAYVIDPKEMRLAVYEYDPRRGGGLKLGGAREIRWDMKIKSYNSDSPSVSKVRDEYLKKQDD
ncbi:MAG: hypothetical protein ACOCXX_02420 [Planctomycetota bacterium]